MISIIFILLFILVALKKPTLIRKHFTIVTILFIVLSTLSFIFSDIAIFTPFKQGYLGFSFIYLVMLTGSLKEKSRLRISLFQLRKEYSILGFIAITPHALFYFIEYLNGVRSLPIYGVIAYSIMIPLFITSFHLIRKKFQYKTWKNIQRFSYIVYVTLLIHLLVNSTTIEIQNTILYIILFSIYFVLKTIYEMKKKH
jgi:DMSO/TMAO reductase YedYZ heme-binding membrane subunit